MISDQIAWHMVDYLRSKEGMWLDYYGYEYGYVSFVVSFPEDDCRELQTQTLWF